MGIDFPFNFDENFINSLMSSELPNMGTIINTGFGPNTLIYINNQIMSIRQLYIGCFEKNIETIGINPEDYLMKRCKLSDAPNEIYVSHTIKLIFGPNLCIECLPSSILLTTEKYRCVSELNPGDTINVTKFNAETNEYFVEEEIITGIDQSRSITNIQTPVYTISTEFTNIFIPFIESNSPIIWLINFKL